MKTKTLFLSVLLAILSPELVGLTFAGEEGGPRISNMRFEGLTVQENKFISSSEFGNEYKILVDFEATAPIGHVYLQTRWANGKVDRVVERKGFEVTPLGALKGTLVIPSRILPNRMSRNTEWWVEDLNGRISNKLIQQVVVRD